MATFKITELSALLSGNVNDSDVLPIVDIDADETKKITISDLKSVFTATPAGSDTQIQFNDGGSFGASSNLVWNGNLGIGTSSPSEKVDVLGNIKTEGKINVHDSALVGTPEVGDIENVGNHFYFTTDTNSYGARRRAMIGEGISSDYAAIYLGVTTPSTTNYAVNANASTTMLNGVNNVDIKRSNTTLARFNSTGFGLGTTSLGANFHQVLSTDQVGYRIDLSNGQTEDALQVNSYNNTGGDLFRITYLGRIRTNANIILEHANAIIEFSDASARGIYSPAYNTGVANTMVFKNWAGITRLSFDFTTSNNVINVGSLPTSSAGLSSGDLWNDSGTVKIV